MRKTPVAHEVTVTVPGTDGVRGPGATGWQCAQSLQLEKSSRTHARQQRYGNFGNWAARGVVDKVRRGWCKEALPSRAGGFAAEVRGIAELTRAPKHKDAP